MEAELKKKYDIAYDFSSKAYKKFQSVVKSIVLFGSTAKDTASEKSDIDIIIIVDNCSIKWDEELTAWYRQELRELIAKQHYGKKLHVNTVTLSAFYDQMLKGEPVVINVIRYGVPLIDFGGFFTPLKVLLATGRIKPSREAIYNALKRAPMHLARAKFNLLAAVDAIYWSMVDSAHAALMSAGKTPPSPEHIDIMLKEFFVKDGKLKQKYVDWYREIFALAHYISHGEIADLKGKEIQMYRDRADEFIGEMAELVKNTKN
nr:nucleotidyltransferase domain-containing protein [Candidatus Woesearchaeota archaeon]